MEIILSPDCRFADWVLALWGGGVVELFASSLPDNVELTEHPVRLLPGEGTSFARCNMAGACCQTIMPSNSEVNEAYSYVCLP
jgi:hypothetical protein